MNRLPENPPAWVSPYIGLPFREKGRSTDGVDCWGLVRLVYAERFGIALPDLSDRYAASEDGPTVERTVEGETAPGGSWRLREAPEVGSVGVFRVKGLPSHVGIAVADGRFLHSFPGVNSVVESYQSPAWSNRLVGWYEFAGAVEVRTRRTIFEAVPGRLELPAGGTIEDMIIAGGIDPSADIRVFLGDREVARKQWRNVRPKAGRRVTVGVVPQGGGGGGNGKTITRVLLTIAVIVAAIYVGPYAATALGYTAAGSAAAISTAVIGLAGTLAVNSLVPPPKPELSGAGDGSSRVSPTIAGARNDIRRYSPVPVIFGVHRVVPPFGALPYTEVVGDDQFLRCLFVIGYGPLSIEDLRIGDTPIEEFDGVEYEIRNGVEGETPTAIYPGIVREQALAITVAQNANWILRTTENDGDEISLDITFARGLATVETNGSRSNRTVVFDIEYAPRGSGAWTTINFESPTDARGLDYFFRTPESTQLATGRRTGQRIDFSVSGVFADPVPAEIAAVSPSRISWEATGYIRVPTTGTYVFAIDAADAADFEIDGRRVVDFYGSHERTGPADYNARQSPTIQLTAGDHPFKFRVEARSYSRLAAALGWKKPGDSLFSTIPADNIVARGGTNRYAFIPSQGYKYRVFDTSLFGGVSLVASDNRVDVIRRTLSWPVPRGQYDVRMRRTTLDSTDDRVIDEATWTALRTVLNDEPIRVKNLARVALRIKATDQLNGVIDTFNVLAGSILSDYDSFSGEWVSRVTNNPASFYRAALQGPANRKPLADSRVSITALAAWHDSNRINGFAGNVVFDYEGTLFERLNIIASLGRATFGIEDGKFAIVRDRVQSTPVQHFTPRNSSGFKGRRSFPDIPHALRVSFLNEEKDFQRDEVTVYDDGFDESNATRFESLELFGITNPGLAWRHGRYYIAAGRLRPETFDLSVDFEHLICRRGDLVLVTHDVPILGTGAGRIRQVVADVSGRPAVVEIDAPLEMQAAKFYAMRVRKKDGTFVLVNIATNPGNQTILYFDSPIPVGQPAPEAGDLFGFGERGYESREMIVRAIQMGADLSAMLTLVDHAPAVHSADTGTIPQFDSGILSPPSWDDGPEAPIIERIRSNDFVMVRGPDGTLVPRIVVYLRRPSASNRPVPVTIQGRYREAGTGAPFRYVASVPAEGLSIAFLPVDQGVEYELAVRYVSADGRVSRWVNALEEVVGHDLPPPNVISFEVQQMSDGTRRFIWELGDPPADVIGVRIRYAAGGAALPWEAMTNLLDGEGVVEGASPTDLAAPGAGTWRFAIKMVDAGGLESPDAVFYEKTLGPPPQANVAWIEDAKSQRWPGAKTNCFVSAPGGELTAGSQRTWATTSTPWSNWRKWNEQPYPEIDYEHPTVDVGFVFDFEPSISFRTEGDQPATVLFDYSVDGVVWNGYANIRSFDGRTVRGRFFRAKITVGNAGMYPIPTLYEFAIILNAPTIVEVLDNLVTSSLPAAYRLGPGHFIAPISSSTFAWIRTVSVSFNGTGAGWSWEIVNKNVFPGPEIRIYNPDDIPTDATVDVTVRGVRSADGSTTSALPGELRFNAARNAVLLSII